MSNSWKILIAVLCMLMLLSSCKKEPDTLEPPYRHDASVLLAAKALKYELREIIFNVDVAILKGDNESKLVEDFNDLPDSSFNFQEGKDERITYEVLNVEYRDTNAFSTFTTMILIDESAYPENFDSTDFTNYRFQAFNAFYRNLNAQGKVLFATYNRIGDEHNVLRKINNTFSNQWEEETVLSLLDLTHKQSGTAALYDALKEAIEIMDVAEGENKSICLFVRNKDDGKSLNTLDEIIALAKEKNIKINVIWLIKDTQNTDLKALRKLSCKTGGFAVYMGKIYQSSTIFMALPDLLRLRYNFYRITVKMTIVSSSYFMETFNDGLRVYYFPPRFYIWNYVPYILEKY